jgi:hypothetical protein
MSQQAVTTTPLISIQDLIFVWHESSLPSAVMQTNRLRLAVDAGRLQAARSLDSVWWVSVNATSNCQL